MTATEAKDGQRVRFKRKQSCFTAGDAAWRTGTVQYVWLALDVEAAQIKADDGPEVSVFPEFGDELESEVAP